MCAGSWKYQREKQTHCMRRKGANGQLFLSAWIYEERGGWSFVSTAHPQHFCHNRGMAYKIKRLPFICLLHAENMHSTTAVDKTCL